MIPLYVQSPLCLCTLVTRGDKVIIHVLLYVVQITYPVYVVIFVTDEGSVPEMRIWSILLIKSVSKWCIHLSRSLMSYFNFPSFKCRWSVLGFFLLMCIHLSAVFFFEYWCLFILLRQISFFSLVKSFNIPDPCHTWIIICDMHMDPNYHIANIMHEHGLVHVAR